jgi:calnexin
MLNALARTESKAAHHAISAVFHEPIDALPERKPLVVQYEVKMQKGLECGGAYLKLLTENPGEGIRAGEDFTDKTPFTIMFGPVSTTTVAHRLKIADAIGCP